MRLEVRDLSFSYPKSEDVLHDVNLSITEPGLYCIIGPNGVGKSTLVKCMDRILKPTSGQVLIDGRDIADMRLRELSSVVGYTPVQTMDVFSMPVVDAILLGRHNRGGWRNSAGDMHLAVKVMRMLGLERYAFRGFNELSAGQHQKVSLGRGLVQQTDIMLLDEPTANLDIRHQAYITELLRGLAVRDGRIIVMISHDLNISAKYAHSLIVMEGGTVAETGSPSDVLTEELVRRVYGIDCRIIDDRGRPHIILGSALSVD